MRLPGTPSLGRTLAVAVAVTALLASPSGGAVVQYANVTADAGVSFRIAGEIHSTENDDWPAFPEIMGGGACFADFDGDGYDDLYLVNQVYNDENPAWDASWVAAADPHSQLYRNLGDGSFEDVSEDAGVDARGFGYGCSAADYDADGYVDLFVANFGDNLLFRNLGDGSFENVSASSGVDMPGACGEFFCMSTSSAWADYDEDGDLDLYVDNYVETTMTDLVRGPNAHVGQMNFLHRNNGDGTFTDVAQQAGVAGNPTDTEGSKSLGCVWFDYDLDGDVDLYVTNDEVPNDFYVNNGDGTFTERSVEANLANPLAGMGLTSGDYDNDGLPDLFFTHYKTEQNGFYRNNGDGTFEDRSGEDDHKNSFVLVGWGTTFLDVDRDMDLDIMLVNGHTEWDVLDYNMVAQIYRNDPNLNPSAQPWNRNWTDITRFSGPGMTEKHVARGAAWSDYDLDGDTDWVMAPNANQTAKLYRASNQTEHWLTLQLRQPGMNARAVGARVALEAGGVTQYREVQVGSSYLSQNTLNLEFGLGPHLLADKVTVQWPGGGTSVFLGLGADQVLRLDRATGAVVRDTLAPFTEATFVGTMGDEGWWHSTVEASIAASDRGVSLVSGLAGTEFRVDDDAWAPYEGQVLTFLEGRHTLRMRSTDLAGNREPVRVEAVDVDATPPEVSATVGGTPGENGWWVSDDVTITLEASDALSGVDAIRYRLDGGAWTTYGEPFPLDTDAIHTIDYEAEDVAGNVAQVMRLEVKLDHTAPTALLTRPDIGHLYWGERDLADVITGPAYVLTTPELNDMGGVVFTLRAQATDATSGVDRVEFRVNGTARAEDASAPYAWPWQVGVEPSGLFLVEAVSHDVAGNTATHRVRVALVGGTVESLLETLLRGPSTDTGLDPLAGPGMPAGNLMVPAALP